MKREEEEPQMDWDKRAAVHRQQLKFREAGTENSFHTSSQVAVLLNPDSFINDVIIDDHVDSAQQSSLSRNHEYKKWCTNTLFLNPCDIQLCRIYRRSAQTLLFEQSKFYALSNVYR